MPFLTTKHAHIHYKEITPLKIRSNKLILVFLHEALGSIEQFKEFPQLLCNAINIEGIVYEREGYGKSTLKTESNSIFHTPRTVDYLLNYALDELPEVLHTLAPDKKIILIGHSDGGTIALQFAKAFPDKVEAVVTLAAHIINESVTRAGIQPAIKAFKQGKLDGLRKYHGNKTNELFLAWANTWLSKAYKNWNAASEITPQRKPGLIIQGKNDQYGTDQQVHLIANCFLSNLAQTKIIQDCGHAPHLEKQNEVIQLITSFVNNLNVFN